MKTSVELGMDAQKMIDYRLDSLDRILISSGMNRAERMDVVQSVEDQIHELVDRRSEGEPTREDVVQVLGELDPPEAYVSDWSNLSGDESITSSPTLAKPKALQNPAYAKTLSTGNYIFRTGDAKYSCY